ncbi:hypothetical protein CA223_19755 [Sphingomonas koreensis]|jgi:hypothetical protein|uniref:Uncharacterized protein n=1 Tax=Sphingomonas koreensis TaxID=93064 RepID=A0A1L6JCN8_9SPHN|nr:hypothetical protein [Sphingomonas koreensis]APR53674.1 hypothetical protein BRX40_15715 [Sphingomonas koreensis]RSU24194.1 hypothetical protein CA224_00125 [Sphingomonas koreensis]RSU25897.1 hypothetical protein CA222_10460 [Sphingomonas koreensis]RSU26050.1 hypothetical protein CA222_11355 [Sphingomonas koreensis]RSU27934.1 hypothetical protein CA225_09745 [Sphingomonas koreensis]
MAPLRFNLHGYSYQDGISVLLNSYHAAQDALDSKRERAVDEAVAYQQGLEEGTVEWQGERDEDGAVIWDHQSILDYNVRDAEEAGKELRKAFCIAMYHHWERSALNWVGKVQLTHAELVAKVEAIPYPVHAKLHELYLLVNTLKHNNAKWAKMLAAERQDLIGIDLQGELTKVNWYGVISVQTKHVEEFFNILAASGPRIDTIRS